jgi:poly(3-hydroxybutyrate) depolymerase
MHLTSEITMTRWQLCLALACCMAVGACGVRTPFPTIAPGKSETIWVQGGPFRLRAYMAVGDSVGARPVLLVVLHGDAPWTKPDYHDTLAARTARHRDVVAVGLLRPGYTDPRGNTSDGVRGETTGDNYHATNTDALAAAIRRLKDRVRARRVVVAGHSGGGTLTANILARHPDLVDAALVVACSCDVRAWRTHMLQQTGYWGFEDEVEILSPIDIVSGLSNDTEVVLVAGTADPIVPLASIEAYEERARRLGKRVRLMRLEGKQHEIFFDPVVLAELHRLLR